MSPRVSIVIPNWNGLSYLSRCVAATLHSAGKIGHDYELIVIDDASSDGSADAVQRDFQTVRLIRNQVNLGFGETMNRAARESVGEFIVCLNNDLLPKPEMIRELVGPLVADDTLFGVSGKTIDWDAGSPNHVNMAAVWTNGEFVIKHQDSKELSATMFLQGGACAMRRSEFLRFGGFCSLYAPGYWEDYDISYLALKAGWNNAYNPQAIAHHLGQGSMKRAYGDSIEITRFRNELRFLALNLTDSHLDLFVRSLPGRVAFRTHPRLLHRINGLCQFAADFSILAKERDRRRNFIRRSDNDIFSQFRNHGSA